MRELLVFIFVFTSLYPNWPRSSASQQNIDEDKLTIAVRKLAGLEQSYSFIVIRNGFLVSENYFHGRFKDDLHEIRSATKSVVSTLIGIAVQQGFIVSVEDKVLSYLPELKVNTGKQYLDSLKIRHLLNMTSGFNWNEHEGDLLRWQNHQNPTEYLLSKGFSEMPGEKFKYNSAAVHLLNSIIERSSGLKTAEFAEKFLWKPLDIDNVNWPKLADEIPNGGYGMSIHPLDLAKIGQLYLNNGTWDEIQILPENWSRQMMLQDKDLKIDFGAFEDARYGKLWWSGNYQNHKVFFALGYAGQFLAIIPDLNMVICVTQDWGLSNTATQREDYVTTIIADLIEASF